MIKKSSENLITCEWSAAEVTVDQSSEKQNIGCVLRLEERIGCAWWVFFRFWFFDVSASMS